MQPKLEYRISYRRLLVCKLFNDTVSANASQMGRVSLSASSRATAPETRNVVSMKVDIGKFYENLSIRSSCG
jgi:hypothetical protein